MRKVLLIAGLVSALVFTGCGGEAPNPTLKDEGIEEIQVEEIIVEEIKVEEIKTEQILIDDSFAEELEFNYRVNTWENSTTYWD
ncbi:MAG: hypothetical protein IJ880_03320 [Bacilli bacterium]|nr:hypothetical protein [Bacilli bacterium]